MAPGIDSAGVDIVFPESLVEGLQTYRHDGVRWRVMVGRDVTGQRFAVAQTVEAREEVALELAALVLLPMALIVPAFLAVSRYGLRRMFAPLERLSRQADVVDGSRLRSLETDDAPDELLPFVKAVNRLLMRLGVQLDQQRQLVSHAAHELRSPVQALVMQAQNVRAVVDNDNAIERIGILGEGLERMSSLIEQLLGLARVQSGARCNLKSISFDDAIRTAAVATLPMATRKSVDFECTRLDPVEAGPPRGCLPAGA